MQLITQYQIQKKEGATSFLRRNAYWYKYLNRNATYLQPFFKEMKEEAQQQAKEKWENTLKMIETLGNVFSTFK